MPGRNGWLRGVRREAVVAGCLVLIAFGALSACFAGIVREVRVSREALRAERIGMEALVGARFSSFSQLSGPRCFTEHFDPGAQESGSTGTTYNITMVPRVPAPGTVPEAYRTNMLLITVDVSWKSGSVQHSRCMQTYVSRHGNKGLRPSFP